MAEKFTVDQKFQIVMEAFTSTNMAELCRRHGVSPKQLRSWRDKFMEAGKRGLAESSGGSQYEKQIDDLKRLVGDQALVIDAFKTMISKPTYKYVRHR